MRILCCTIPERGHVNPLLPTLARLAQRGHEVVVAASRDLSAAVGEVAPGLRTMTLAAPPPPAAFVTSGRAFAERLRDAVWLRGWIQALLLDAAPALIAPVRRAIDELCPDVLVLDPMLYGAVIAAEQSGVPWAAVSSSLNPVTPSSARAPLIDTLLALADQRAALFWRHGVSTPRFAVADALSPWLTIAFTTSAYVDVPRHVHACGAPFDDDDVALALALPGAGALRAALGASGPGTSADPGGDGPTRERRAYVSFGSQAFHQPALFDVIFRACARLGLRVIASVGDLVDDDSFVRAAPRSAVLLRYAPQLAVLEEVDVVICHGGANSVVEALRRGRPVLLAPLCNDQHLQAALLTRSGCGDALTTDTLGGDVASVAHAVVRVMRDGAAARERVSAGLRSGGPTLAADLIERLATTRQPVRTA